MLCVGARVITCIHVYKYACRRGLDLRARLFAACVRGCFCGRGNACYLTCACMVFLGYTHTHTCKCAFLWCSLVCVDVYYHQVTLMILESDQMKASSFDTTGFVNVYVLSNATRLSVFQAALWMRQQRFDAVFYPQVLYRARPAHSQECITANPSLSVFTAISQPVLECLHCDLTSCD